MRELISLHKHWLNADAVKQFVTSKVEGGKNMNENILKEAQMLSSFSRLTVFYGLIYVVIEGYKELKYSNDAIDKLLNNEEFVDSLRLFRNSTFHYQKEPISEKALKFLELPESENWIRQLNLAFIAFFEEKLSIKEIASNFYS